MQSLEQFNGWCKSQEDLSIQRMDHSFGANSSPPVHKKTDCTPEQLAGKEDYMAFLNKVEKNSNPASTISILRNNSSLNQKV